ncbi:hypothetical protein DUNSADRAFT_7754 [Dunaliella salina]|uniref:Uncharacterized protein n=1 Tax=Dunaliella salina TaxID=3046 RepID=A0ABQ7GKS8_DUNSA|nr:hypothetical protein DUNSADRAFT_7754 [Dunaliella salina]|eukprot:KAF5835212.1 hypothetical protein DUNSADRAFT_7754 [Dunaliella salina]
MIDAELDRREYRCGCRCTSCCAFVPRSSLADDGSLGPGAGGLGIGQDGMKNNDDFKKVCYDATPDRPCPPTAECLEYDDTTCGPQYSTYEQIPFCGVPRPPTWPALVQFPLAKYRPRTAEPASPSGAAARSEPSNLLAAPEPSPSGDAEGGGNSDVRPEAAKEGSGGGGALQFSDSGPPAVLPFTGILDVVYLGARQREP